MQTAFGRDPVTLNLDFGAFFSQRIVMHFLNRWFLCTGILHILLSSAVGMQLGRRQFPEPCFLDSVFGVIYPYLEGIWVAAITVLESHTS